MRFMVIVKANTQSEAGVMPRTEELAAMGAYNDALIKAGIMLAGEGLHPSSRGARVRFDSENRAVVTDGPFAATPELVAGYWLWQCKSRDEALAWLERAPFRNAEVELRQVFEMDDFGDAMTPELRAQEDRQRVDIATRG